MNKQLDWSENFLEFYQKNYCKSSEWYQIDTILSGSFGIIQSIQGIDPLFHKQETNLALT